MGVFGWLLLIWIVGAFPPVGVVIGVIALIGAAIGSCFRR